MNLGGKELVHLLFCFETEVIPLFHLDILFKGFFLLKILGTPKRLFKGMLVLFCLLCF